jgi:hypothetical protein
MLFFKHFQIFYNANQQQKTRRQCDGLWSARQIELSAFLFLPSTLFMAVRFEALPAFMLRHL